MSNLEGKVKVPSRAKSRFAMKTSGFPKLRVPWLQSKPSVHNTHWGAFASTPLGFGELESRHKMMLILLSVLGVIKSFISAPRVSWLLSACIEP